MSIEYTPHGLHANPLRPERCKASVHEPGRGIFIHQCQRKPWKDGWCRQHHPDTESARREESRKADESKRENSPWRLLEKARAEIAALKAGGVVLCEGTLSHKECGVVDGNEVPMLWVLRQRWSMLESLWGHRVQITVRDLGEGK